MRVRAVIGTFLIAIGVFILVRGLTYTSHREVLKFGGLEASVEEKRTIPPWVGGVAIAGGLLLIVVGRWPRRQE